MSDIEALVAGCRIETDSILEAYGLMTEEEKIIKIVDIRVGGLKYRRVDGRESFKVDLIRNFRRLDGRTLEYIDTRVGAIRTPRFWPMTLTMDKKYGLPHNDGDDILVDAYVVDSDWKIKIEELVDGYLFIKNCGRRH